MPERVQYRNDDGDPVCPDCGRIYVNRGLGVTCPQCRAEMLDYCEREHAAGLTE